MDWTACAFYFYFEMHEHMLRHAIESVERTWKVSSPSNEFNYYFPERRKKTFKSIGRLTQDKRVSVGSRVQIESWQNSKIETPYILHACIQCNKRAKFHVNIEKCFCFFHLLVAKVVRVFPLFHLEFRFICDFCLRLKNTFRFIYNTPCTSYIVTTLYTGHWP